MTNPAPASVALTRLETIRRAIRPLDCGHHYCRYCNAGSNNGWQHRQHCAYEESVVCAEAARRYLDELAVQLTEHAAQIATLQAEADELFAELQKTRTRREAEAKEEAVRLRAMASSALATLRERVAVVEQKMRHPLWNGQRMPVSSRDVSEWADELAAVLHSDPTTEEK